MTWPNSQDYFEVVQCPLSAFSDSDLRAGEVVVNAIGLPVPCAGNFADVYEYRTPHGRWALKCFTRETPNLRERYRRISKQLQQARLPFIADFQFFDSGIRIRGQWFPILKMEWIEGLLLNEFVRNNLDKPHLLKSLLPFWLRMSTLMREASIAHADLQHGNVILVPGSQSNSLAVKLIDYDGMYVPSLAGTMSGEVGHASYQHPQRRTRDYNLEVDRFSLLTVACALRSLAVAGGSLWEKYDNGDNLLFRATDFQLPQQSALFRELWNLPDATTRDLTGYLVLSLALPPDRAPRLDQVFQGAEAVETVPLSKERRDSVTSILGAATVIALSHKPTGSDLKAPDETKTKASRRQALWIGGGIALSVVFVGLVFPLDRKNQITNSIGMKLVWIAPGTFLMGSPRTELGRAEGEIELQHQVELTRGFHMGVFEVTQEEYEKVMLANPSRFCRDGRGRGEVLRMDTGRFPVEGVKWDDANEFCKKLSELPEENAKGHLYDLPTEAEWEYACREGKYSRQDANASGGNAPLHMGDILASKRVNFAESELRRTTTVGKYPANAFGLYDMHGNVWEWCRDWYREDYYEASPPRNPPGPLKGSERVIRGGGWTDNRDLCRSAYRGKRFPFLPNDDLGFRVVLRSQEAQKQLIPFKVGFSLPIPGQRSPKSSIEQVMQKTGGPLQIVVS